MNLLRASLPFGLGNAASATIVYGFVGLFLLYPVAILFLDSVLIDGRLSLDLYSEFFSQDYTGRIFSNSLIASVLTVIVASLIGVPLAYVLSRYPVRGRSLFMTISLLPMIMPPFVGALSFLFLFGNAGTINLILMDWLRITDTPINLIKGLHGLVFIEAIHLYPLIYLNSAAAFTSIDPSLEEASEVQGASGLRRFFTVTFPLATPGYAAGAFLVFIWTFADWTTPAILGLSPSFLASQTFEDITQFIDVPRLRRGLVSSSIIVLFSVLILFAMRRYVEARQYISLSKGVSREGRVLELEGKRRILAYAIVCGVAVLSLLAPTWLILGSVAYNWGLTPFPTAYTLDHYAYIINETPRYLTNSFLFSGLAASIDLVIGVMTALLLARTRIFGRNMLDGLVTMALAIPGIVFGVGYLRAFHRFELPYLQETLTGLWIVIPLVIAVRRVPYVVRSSHASLLQLDTALEEASEILGANKLRTFSRITLPLIVRGIMAGTIFSFITSIQEVSSSMFLYRPGWETVPIGTFILFTSSGDFSRPAALGVVLLLVTGAAIALANKLGGRKLGGAFGI